MIGTVALGESPALGIRALALDQGSALGVRALSLRHRAAGALDDRRRRLADAGGLPDALALRGRRSRRHGKRTDQQKNPGQPHVLFLQGRS